MPRDALAVPPTDNMSTEHHSLIAAAFASALSLPMRSSFFDGLTSPFRGPRAGKEFESAIARSSRNDLRARETKDGQGLALVWRAEGQLKRSRVRWSALADLPVPVEVAPQVAFASRQRASAIFDKATTSFLAEIQSGRMELMARRASPLEPRSRIPPEAARYVVVDCWFTGLGHIAGERLFDIEVVPPLDQEVAYREKIAAAGGVWARLLPIVIEKLWPNGLPPETRLSNQQFGNMLQKEIERLGFDPPNEKTFHRARRDYKRTTRDR